MTVERISKTLEDAIQLCDSNSGLSLDNIALYVTYEGTQYKLKGIDSLKYLLETPIIDRPNWESYFHTNPYLGASIYEVMAALYYKTQGYKVYISRGQADRQGIDLVIVDPKTKNKRLIQVKGKSYIKQKKNTGRELKYKLYGVELLILDIEKFTHTVENTPINKFLQDIFLGKPTTANLWRKIDLPTCEFEIQRSQAFKYQIHAVDTLKSKGIYAVPVKDRQIAYYTFSTGKWTFIQINSHTYQQVVNKILQGVLSINTSSELEQVSVEECYPNISLAINKLKKLGHSILTFDNNYIGTYHSGQWHYVKVQCNESANTIVENVANTQNTVEVNCPKAWRTTLDKLQKEADVLIFLTTKNRIAIKKGFKWVYYLAHPGSKSSTIESKIKECLELLDYEM